jgi:DNA replicative helicase MCM subunit Mcm2 (Cdc46/Mcm family)
MNKRPINKSKFVCRDCGHEMWLHNGFRARSEKDHCPSCGSSFVEKDVKIPPNPAKRRKKKAGGS